MMQVSAESAPTPPSLPLYFSFLPISSSPSLLSPLSVQVLGGPLGLQTPYPRVCCRLQAPSGQFCHSPYDTVTCHILVFLGMSLYLIHSVFYVTSPQFRPVS